MKRDTDNSIGQIADLLAIEASSEQIAAVLDAVSPEQMKNRAADHVLRGGEVWKRGAETFLNTGTNGRWHDVLSAQELKFYEAACDRTLGEDCRARLKGVGGV